MEDHDVPFIERIDDLEGFISQRGPVQTDSNEQAFGVIQALSEWDPRVTIVTQEYFPDAIAIEARIGESEPLQPNAMETMAFDPDAWNNKLDAYPQWQSAWWREVIQNASDARGPEKPEGATRVDLECYTEQYTDIEGVTVTAVRVSAYDNGVGMSEDVLRNAFLSWSGSHKPEGSTGGFGDAKELIIIPWLGYEIHTRDKIARGRHNEFEITDAPHLEGTRVTTWMPVSKATTVEYAASFLDRCYLPNLTIRINGKTHNARLTSDSMVDGYPIPIVASYSTGAHDRGDNVGEVAIYHNSRTRKRGVLVRSNGVFMFDLYADTSKYKGSVLIELTGEPRMLFDQKRVRFSGKTDVENIVDSFIRKLTIDPRSSLQKQRADSGKVRTVYGGSGALEVAAGEAARIAAKMAMSAPVSNQKSWTDGSVSYTKESIDEIAEMLEDEPDELPEGALGSKGSAVPAWAPVQVSSARVMLGDSKFGNAEDAANALRMMAWKPAFLLVNEVDFFDVPSDVKPEYMSHTYKTLAIMWMEICRFVLMRLGFKGMFGVGWIFQQGEEETTIAAATKEDLNGTYVPFLLLNPIKLTEDNVRRDSYGDIANITYKKTLRWKLGTPEVLKTMCAVAVHECTHMVDGLSEHDEQFVSAMTINMGKMLDMLPVAKKIRKAVLDQAKQDKGSETTPKIVAAFAQALGLRWQQVGTYYIGSVIQNNNLRSRFTIYKYPAAQGGGLEIRDQDHPGEHQTPVKNARDAKSIGARILVSEYGGVPSDWSTAIKDAEAKGAEFGTSFVYTLENGIKDMRFEWMLSYPMVKLVDEVAHDVTAWPTDQMAKYEAARRILGKVPRDGIEDMKTGGSSAATLSSPSPSSVKYSTLQDGNKTHVSLGTVGRVGTVIKENGEVWSAIFDDSMVTDRGKMFLFDSEMDAYDYIRMLAEKSLPKYDDVNPHEIPMGDNFSIAIALVLALHHGEPGKALLHGASATIAESLVRQIKADSANVQGWFWWQLTTMIISPDRSAFDNDDGEVWESVPISIPRISIPDIVWSGREAINVLQSSWLPDSSMKWPEAMSLMLVAALRSVYKADDLKRVLRGS